MRRTLEGSVFSSFLPPAMRELIVLMIASPFSERRSSKIGMSIDYIAFFVSRAINTNEKLIARTPRSLIRRSKASFSRLTPARYLASSQLML